MQIACPSCGAEVTTDPGELAACSACGHWWIAEEPGVEDLTLDQTVEEDPLDEPFEDGDDAGAPGPSGDGEPHRDAGPALEPERDAQGDPEPIEGASSAPVVAALERARDLPSVVASPTPTPPDHPWEFELQFAVGDQVQGPWDRMHLREQLYQGRLTGEERIRVPGAHDWERLADRPEFAEVLHLLGKDAPKLVGNKRIAGWQRAGADAVTHTGQAPRPEPAPAAPPSPSPMAAAPQPPAPAPGPAPAASPPAGGPNIVLVGGVIVAVVAILGVLAFFALG